MAKRLLPSLTLADIYGGEPVYSPRTSPNSCTWMPRGMEVRDMSTGGQLTVLGDMPVLCASVVTTPEALGLLRDAELPVPEETFRYSDTSDYLRQLSLLGESGRKIAVQHVHPVSELAPDRYWVKPSILSFLNNKANLAELVGQPHLPGRRILPPKDIFDGCPVPNLPFVVKAITNEPNGGGVDVVICFTVDDFRNAREYFQTCPQVIVEDFIEMERNLCLNYAASNDGAITYLGSAEQVTDSKAQYQGNWIDSASEAPALAVEVGKQIVRRGFALGYRGCVGIDMAIMADGRVVVFDLNFRICGSTTTLLLADSVRRTLGSKVMRLRSWKGNGTYGEMLDAVYAAMEEGIVLPLGSLDPRASAYPDAAPRLSGLVLGASRDEVRERERQLAELGLED